jgi:hypothetical protein
MRKWGVLFAVALGIAGCSGSQEASTTTVAQTVTASAETTPQPPAESGKAAQGQPPRSYESYSAPGYTLERPSGWITVEDQTAKSGFVESKWQDPSDPLTSVLIDNLPSANSSAQADAASVRAQTSSTAGYREISFEPTSIGGNDAWKWVFAVSGTGRVDYFMNVCGTSFAILGKAPPRRFNQLAGTFQHVVESVQPTCRSSPSGPAPSITDATTTAPPAGDFCATHTCIPNFPNGTGSIVQCADGEWSHSGGRPGACSHHGGETSTTYP